MTKRYELMTSREARDGKKYWTRIGTMFRMKDGKDGFQIVLDALPLAQSDGRVVVSAFPPRDQDEPSQQRQSHRSGSATASSSFDDDIPF